MEGGREGDGGSEGGKEEGDGGKEREGAYTTLSNI